MPYMPASRCHMAFLDMEHVGVFLESRPVAVPHARSAPAQLAIIGEMIQWRERRRADRNGQRSHACGTAAPSPALPWLEVESS